MEELLQKAIEFLASASGQSMTIAIVLDFVFRLVPSKKPLSILHVVAKVSKLAGEFLVKAAELMDKVLPQVVKEEEQK